MIAASSDARQFAGNHLGAVGGIKSLLLRQIGARLEARGRWKGITRRM